MVSRELARGLLLAFTSLLFLVQAPKYAIGGLARMGPALFPMIAAGSLLVTSIAIIVRSRFVATEALDFRFKNIALIIASIVSFTLVSHYVNMFAAIAVMVTMASLAGNEFSIKRVAAITAVLCLIAVAMRDGLGVQLPLY